ncbi:MAG: M16 family metallopeptidase [Eubacteriales bacterium]
MVKIDKLDNGVKIVMEQLPSVRSVAIGIWVKSGSIYEDEYNNGISHFIEHMLFKGTEKRAAKQIAEDMSAIGGHINAFTGKEYTCFYAQTLDEHIEIGIDILSDMLQNSLFSNEDIKKEKTVVLEEIDMVEDSPEEVALDSFHQNVWKGHSLGFSILGGKDNIKNLTREDLINYYKKYYTTDNIVISVAGHFEFNYIKELLNTYFRDINTKSSKGSIEDPKYHRSFLYRNKDIEQVHLCLGFEGIHYYSDKLYTLAILNTILGGSMSSRLFQGIREEKGLAYSIYSFTSTYQEAGLLNIYAATNPNSINEVLEQVKDEVSWLKQNGITQDELDKTKEQLKSNYIIGLESTNSRMSSNGKSIILLNRIKTQDEIIDKLNTVTLEDFNELTRDIFQMNELSLTFVGRTKNIDIEKVKDVWAE